MNRCIYKTTDGNCTLHSDGIEYIEPCVESPCEDEKFKHDVVIKRKPTNADRIRAMGDEELAEFITNTDFCELTCGLEHVCDGQCKIPVLNWLKQPSKDEP